MTQREWCILHCVVCLVVWGFLFVVALFFMWGFFFGLNIVCSVQGSFSPFQVWSDFSLVGVSCFCIISLTAICV